MNSKTFRKQILEHLEDYIMEAEHQEGEKYWERTDLVKDFGLYLQEI